MKRLSLISVMVLVIAMTSFGADVNETTTRQKQKRFTKEEIKQKMQQGQDKREQMRDKMEQKNQQFEAKIAEIRKIAESENATKTVAALDELLSNHQKQVAEMKKQAQARKEEMEKRRQERQEQGGRNFRQGGMGENRPPMPPQNDAGGEL